MSRSFFRSLSKYAKGGAVYVNWVTRETFSMGLEKNQVTRECLRAFEDSSPNSAGMEKTSLTQFMNIVHKLSHLKYF